MPAQNTDKFKKVAPNTGWQVGGGGVADSEVTTIPLNVSTGLPSSTAVLVTIDRVDASGNKTPSKMERIVGVVNDNNIVNCIRGVEGTAQSHAAGAVVEIVIASKLWNDMVDGILAEHNQDGSHSDVLMNKIYPIGSVYINADDDTDPAELLGFGTWEAIAAGRVLVGQDTGDTDFDTLGENYGEKEHSLTTDEIPSHYHTVNPPSTSTDNDTHNHGVYVAGNRAASGSAESVPVGSGGTVNTANDTHNHTVDIPQFNSGNAGGGSAHNNIQPSLVVKIWKRTA